MRGLIGFRLLKRFAGNNQHSPEHKDVPEAGSNHADGEAGYSSENRSIYTPPEYPDSTVHETKSEAEAAKQRERT